VVLELLHHGLQPLLEVAAVAGAGEQRAHVEREDRGPASTSGVSPSTIFLRQALGDGGLADAGVADQQRVVLAAAAEHLDAALDLLLAADQRVDVALAGLGVEVDAVFRQRGLLCPSPLGRAARLLCSVGRAAHGALSP
jgi:hypothetical protein